MKSDKICFFHLSLLYYLYEKDNDIDFRQQSESAKEVPLWMQDNAHNISESFMNFMKANNLKCTDQGNTGCVRDLYNF